MLKLEIDEKFEELSYLYDLFENITRIDYVPLEFREEIKQSLIKAYKDGNQEFEKIHEKLKRLVQLQNDIKLNETQIDDLTLEVANYKHALEEKNEIIMDLKEENKELLVNKNLAQAIALKYKKTIEILKDKRVNIDLLLNSSECPTYNFYAKKQD